jgi:hypothetical protein
MYELISPGQHITLSKSSFTFFVILLIWSGVWKAIALWKSSRNNQLGWFIALAILNTAGILEIVYLVFLQPKQDKADANKT